MPELFRTAQDVVQRLVAECRPDAPLYQQHRKSMAQISRTSKWLLNALAALDQELQSSTEDAAS